LLITLKSKEQKLFISRYPVYSKSEEGQSIIEMLHEKKDEKKEENISV